MATKSQTSPEGRIDRRITPRSASKPPDPTVPIVFKNAWGDVDQVFHSTSLGMPCELAAALSAVFHERDAGGSPQTRRHKWRALRLFGSFLQSEGILSASTATQHYLKTQGDLTATGAVLNHANLVTTNRYVEGPAARRFEQETIAGLQRLMVSWITSPQSAPVATPIKDAVTAQLAHRCLAPGEQRADGTIHVCRHIAGCLVCPGLIVPVDAEHLARILQARDHLREAQDLIDPERWRLFYAPSLQVLEQDLLPVFAPELHLAAEQLLPSLPPLPDIE